MIWRPIENSRYEVSERGDVRHRERKQVLKAVVVKGNPYLIVAINGLSVGARQRTVAVHRLVARAFLGNPTEARPHVNHKDANKLNNHYLNLEYVSASENAAHAVHLGRINKGEQVPQSKLITEQVLEIRKRDKDNSSQLAREFGVSRKTIRRIINRKSWKHLPAPPIELPK
jgi:hypothetical protein